MNAKERQAVNNAKKTADNTNTSSFNPQSPELPGGAVSDNLMSLSLNMKRTIKKVVVHNAFAMAMQDFAAGDYGDIEDEIFAQFSGEMLSPLEGQFKALQEGRTLKQVELQPALPPSSGELTGTSSSTC